MGNAFSLPLSMASAGECCQLEGHRGEEGLHLLHGLFSEERDAGFRWYVDDGSVPLGIKNAFSLDVLLYQHQPHDFYKLGTTWFLC